MGQNDLELDQLDNTEMDDFENKAFSTEVQPGELDDNFRPKSGRHVSNPELEQVLQARQTDNNRNSQNNQFWGNLANDVIKDSHGNTPMSVSNALHSKNTSVRLRLCKDHAYH